MAAVFLQQYAQALGVEDVSAQNEIVARALQEQSPEQTVQSVVEQAQALVPLEEGS
jgi:hypothetical protein